MSYSIHIVTHNSEPYLEEVLRRCTTLQPAASAMIIVDNASTDETLPIVQRFQGEHPRDCVVLRNAMNVGFARAHNQAIALALRKDMEYALILNPDVYLEEDFPAHLLSPLERSEQLGSAIGKLLRMESVSQTRSRIIDSTGILIRRSLRMVDRGAGEFDRGQYDQQGEVFGGSAAALMLRLSAATDSALDGQIFDERFMNYKEDIDLAWRLQWRGWRCWYEPSAVGVHLRSHRGGPLIEMLRQRQQRSSATRRSSFRNHYWVLIKNVPMTTPLINLPWILPFEFLRILYVAIMEPAILAAIGDVVRSLRQTLRLRRMIFKRALSDRAIVSRWVGWS